MLEHALSSYAMIDYVILISLDKLGYIFAYFTGTDHTSQAAQSVATPGTEELCCLGIDFEPDYSFEWNWKRFFGHLIDSLCATICTSFRIYCSSNGAGDVDLLTFA